MEKPNKSQQAAQEKLISVGQFCRWYVSSMLVFVFLFTLIAINLRVVPLPIILTVPIFALAATYFTLKLVFKGLRFKKGDKVAKAICLTNLVLYSAVLLLILLNARTLHLMQLLGLTIVFIPVFVLSFIGGKKLEKNSINPLHLQEAEK